MVKLLKDTTITLKVNSGIKAALQEQAKTKGLSLSVFLLKSAIESSSIDTDAIVVKAVKK